MNEKTMSMFKIIFGNDDLQRINVISNNEVSVDLHGLGTRASLTLVNNVINLNRGKCELSIIHGFHHGTALKDMINRRFTNHRIIGMKPVEGNPGVTVLECAAAT